MIDEEKVWYRISAELEILEIGVVQVQLHINDGTGKEDDSGSKDYDSRGHSREGDWRWNIMFGE